MTSAYQSLICHSCRTVSFIVKKVKMSLETTANSICYQKQHFYEYREVAARNSRWTGLILRQRAKIAAFNWCAIIPSYGFIPARSGAVPSAVAQSLTAAQFQSVCRWQDEDTSVTLWSRRKSQLTLFLSTSISTSSQKTQVETGWVCRSGDSRSLNYLGFIRNLRCSIVWGRCKFCWQRISPV